MPVKGVDTKRRKGYVVDICKEVKCECWKRNTGESSLWGNEFGNRDTFWSVVVVVGDALAQLCQNTTFRLEEKVDHPVNVFTHMKLRGKFNEIIAFSILPGCFAGMEVNDSFILILLPMHRRMFQPGVFGKRCYRPWILLKIGRLPNQPKLQFSHLQIYL